MELTEKYKQTDIGLIPSDWEILEIKDIALFTSGKGINVSNLSSQSSSNPIPVYGGNGIAGYTSKILIDKPVVVVGRVGQKCGEVYLASEPSWITDNALYPYKFIRDINLDYLTKAMQFSEINDVKNKNDLPLITQSILHLIKIPVPPKAEQTAIATALGDADTYISSLEKLIAKKQAIKQGAMQQLLAPKAHWVVKKLGSEVKFQVGYPFSSIYFNQKGIGIRLAKNRDLKSDDTIFHFSSSFPKEYLIKNGDVLIGMDGDFVPCLWNKGSALLNQRIGRLVALTDVNLTFLFYYLAKPLKEIENRTSSTTVKHLSHGDIENIEIEMPSPEDQTRIATILSEMDADIAVTERQLAKARSIKQGMMQQLLTGKIRLV